MVGSKKIIEGPSPGSRPGAGPKPGKSERGHRAVIVREKSRKIPEIDRKFAKCWKRRPTRPSATRHRAPALSPPTQPLLPAVGGARAPRLGRALCYPGPAREQRKPALHLRSIWSLRRDTRVRAGPARGWDPRKPRFKGLRRRLIACCPRSRERY